MKNFVLYMASAMIWGSTWLVITFQLGDVDPLISVCYRFILAGFIVFIYCLITRKPMNFSIHQHLFMLLQGLLMFGVNYWLVYLSEQYLTSGLVAVIFSIIVFLNIVNERVFLGTPIKANVMIGAVIGFIGIGLVFKPEIFSIHFSKENLNGLIIAFISAIFASFGNITSARNQKHSIPVVQSNAYSMTYGAVLMIILSLVMGKSFKFIFSFEYISSLLYLAIVGSVVAFGCFLTLIGRIGAGKAAYIALIIPVIALLFSTFFEGYKWTSYSLVGVILIIAGNILIIKKKSAA